MLPNLQETADLDTFTEDIFKKKNFETSTGKLRFLCWVICSNSSASFSNLPLISFYY